MKTRIKTFLLFISLVQLSILLCGSPLKAQEDLNKGVYFVQSLSELELAGDAGSPFSTGHDGWNMEYWVNATWARVVLDQPGDAFLQIGEAAFNRFNPRPRGQFGGNVPEPGYQIAIRLDEPGDVTGTLYFPNEWNGPLVAYRFSIKADQFTAERNEFLNVKLSQYLYFRNSQLTGAAWFRYQANEIQKELGQTDLANVDGTAQDVNWQTESEMERS
jgi:hypothetical protein